MNKTLVTQTKKREKIQITNIRNESGDMTIDSTEIKWIMRECYKQLYTKNLSKLHEMHKFLEIQNLPRLNHKEM